ncbi:MAG: hypothetical protein ABI415_05615 [Flavitalea sp.]
MWWLTGVFGADIYDYELIWNNMQVYTYCYGSSGPVLHVRSGMDSIIWV